MKTWKDQIFIFKVEKKFREGKKISASEIKRYALLHPRIFEVKGDTVRLVPNGKEKKIESL